MGFVLSVTSSMRPRHSRYTRRVPGRWLAHGSRRRMPAAASGGLAGYRGAAVAATLDA